MVWVEWGSVGDGLDASADTADVVGIGGCAWGSYAGGRHGRGRHGRLDASENNTAAEVEAEDTGYAIGTVVNCRAKGSGERRHVFWGKGFVSRTEGCVEAVEGVGDGVPFFLRFSKCSFKWFGIGGRRGGADTIVGCLIEAARKADRSRVRHHAVHRRRMVGAGVCGRGRRWASCLCCFLALEVCSLFAR